MAGSVNKVILIGNVGRDPETRTLAAGGEVANFSIATSESWRDKTSGERQERTEWHRIAVFAEPLVKVVKDYVRKGSKLYVEGQLQTRKWQDRDGQDRYTTEVVLRPFRGEIHLLDRKDDHQASQQPASGQGGYAAASSPAAPRSAAQPAEQPPPFDDEVPF